MPHQPEQPKQTYKPVITPWRCKKCQREIGHAHIVTIAGVDNLMLGQNKVFRIEVVCTNCGTVNYWNAREREMTEQTEAFLTLLAKVEQTQEVSSS